VRPLIECFSKCLWQAGKEHPPRMIPVAPRMREGPPSLVEGTFHSHRKAQKQMPWSALIVAKEFDQASQVQVALKGQYQPQLGRQNEIVLSPPNEIVLSDFGEKKVSM
jgi:hypothetical protein